MSDTISGEDLLRSHQIAEALREHERDGSPQISEKVDVEDFAEEYIDGMSKKVKNLKKAYRHVRKVRKDGSCFYRAVMFTILERCYQETHKSHDGDDDAQATTKEAHNKDTPSTKGLAPTASNSGGKLRSEWSKTLLEKFEASKSLVVEAGFEFSIIEDFFEEAVEAVKAVTAESATAATLAALFDDSSSPGSGDGLVFLARTLTSVHLRLNADKFLPFCEGYFLMPDFCRAEVEPLSADANNVQMTALTEFLDIRMKVVYVTSTSESNCEEIVFQQDASLGSGDNAAEEIVLLYTPGHYDILYR